MKRVRFQRFARKEFREAVRFYNQRKPGLGAHFTDAVEEAVSTLQRDPTRWRRHPGTPFRRCSVKQFPFVIVYVETDETIWVMAVAHNSRRPDYWRGRQLE